MKAMDDIWKLVKSNIFNLAARASLEQQHRSHPQRLPSSFINVKQNALKNLGCPVIVDFKFREIETGILTEVFNAKSISKKDYPLDRYSRVSETAKVQVYI